MRHSATFLLCVVLCGCAAPKTRIGANEARGVVEKYVGGVESKTSGPLTKKWKAELDSLSDVDRKKAVALLDQGSFGFAVYVLTGYFTSAKGPLPEVMTLDRIVFVQDREVIGDFKAK